MAIDIKDIINLIVKQGTDISKILFEYAKLKQKLNDSENQSEYFQYGIQSHLEKLIKLKDDFEDIRSDFNNSNLDVLISNLNELKHESQELMKQSLNTNRLIYLSSLKSNISYLEELIEIKSRISKMMPIDYYTKNTDDFLIITGWKSGV